MVHVSHLLSWSGMFISKLWLDMNLFQHEQVLQSVSIANVTPDQKNFVDKVRVLH